MNEQSENLASNGPVCAPWHRFIRWSGWDSVPTPGFGFIIVGAFIIVVGLVVFHTCAGLSFYWLGAGLLLVGVGIGLQTGMVALAFIGPLAAILLIVGYVLAPAGHC